MGSHSSCCNSDLIAAELASAAEIRVLAVGATKEAYVELVPEFEKSSGHQVVTTGPAARTSRSK